VTTTPAVFRFMRASLLTHLSGVCLRIIRV
jgi:hypothetical protein